MNINWIDYILGNLMVITQESKEETKQMTPFFHIIFELCLWYSFLYFKIVKIHFYGVAPLEK